MFQLQKEIDYLTRQITEIQGIIKPLEDCIRSLEGVRSELDAKLSLEIRSRINEILHPEATCYECGDPVTLRNGRVDGEALCDCCESELR